MAAVLFPLNFLPTYTVCRPRMGLPAHPHPRDEGQYPCAHTDVNDLARWAKAGDRCALADLSSALEDTVRALAWKFGDWREQDDAKQEARLAILRAVRAWNPDGEASFD